MAEVHHEPQNSRFVARLDEAGGDIAFLSYALSQTSSPPYMDLQHTFTPETMRGKGVAGSMVEAAFAYAREKSLKIIPTCSYIPVWVRRHPDQIDLIRAPE